MLKCLINITITQTPTADFPTRDSTFILNSCHAIEIEQGWHNLTQKASFKIPRKIYLPKADATMQALYRKITGKATNVVIGGWNLSDAAIPVFMRGDKVSISLGYEYPYRSSKSGNGFEYTISYGGQGDAVTPRFTGFISSVDMVRAPIVISCEDNMFLLKQINIPNKAYPAAVNNLGSILADIQTAVNAKHPGYITIEEGPGNTYQCNCGDFRTKNESAAKVLARLKRENRLYCYFRNDTLRAGGIVYYPEDMNVVGQFSFEDNIIQSDLKFVRKDDISLGARCYSVLKANQTKTNATGGTRTVSSRIETTVYLNVDGTYTTDDTDTSSEGKDTVTEFFTFYFENITDKTALAKAGAAELQKYNYDGLHGNFTTFGLPWMQFGNIAQLNSAIMPEENGKYLNKAVKTTFEATEHGGIRQHIELHLRTDVLSKDVLNAGI